MGDAGKRSTGKRELLERGGIEEKKTTKKQANKKTGEPTGVWGWCTSGGLVARRWCAGYLGYGILFHTIPYPRTEYNYYIYMTDTFICI